MINTDFFADTIRKTFATGALYGHLIRISRELAEGEISLAQAEDLYWLVDGQGNSYLREDVTTILYAAEVSTLDALPMAEKLYARWQAILAAEGVEPEAYTPEMRKAAAAAGKLQKLSAQAGKDYPNKEGDAGTGATQSGPYPARAGKGKASGPAAAATDDPATVAGPVAVVTTKLPRKVLHLRVSGLEAHPLLERMTMLGDLAGQLAGKAKRAGKARGEYAEAAGEAAASLAALKASIAERGVLEPLLGVPGENGKVLIVDGRHRLLGAIEAGLATVPVLLRPASEARDIIADAVLARRHFSKSALAYLAVLTHPEVATEAAERQVAKLNRGTNPRPAQNAGREEKGRENMETLANRHGVALRLIEQACELYRLAQANPEISGDAEMAIWAGSGLGGVLAGMKALLAGGTVKNQSAEAKRAIAAWNLIDKAQGQFRAAWEKWDALDADHRKLALGRIRDAVATAPREVKTLLLEVLA